MMQSFFCQENNTETNEDYSAELSETQVLLSSLKNSEKIGQSQEDQDRKKCAVQKK